MIKYVAGVFLLVLSAAAFAGPKPSDVPAYIQQPVVYASGGNAPIIGDGSNAWGGTPPAYANQPIGDNVDQANRASHLTGGAGIWCGGDVNDPNRCVDAQGNWREAQPKSRFVFLPSKNGKVLCDDPIRNYTQSGASHCHQFFQNEGVNAYSTYLSLRKRARTSGVNGNPLNATAYWHPAVCKTNPFGNGNDYCLIPDYVGVYYAFDTVEEAQRSVPIAFGQRFVTGINMDDPDDAIPKAEIAAANAQPGNAGRYQYRGNGFNGYLCVNGTVNVPADADAPPGKSAPYVKALTKNDGVSDPWSGRCTAGMQIEASINAPECWDGVNLWSPSGYSHFRHRIFDSFNAKFVCPQGWYWQPRGEYKFFFTITQTGEYVNWWLTSDQMMRDKLTALGTPRTVLPGESFHTDWLGAWDRQTMLNWQNFCIGVQGQTPHECNSNTINATEKLPNVPTDIRHGSGSPSAMRRLPASARGPGTSHTHGGM